jgi:hypothetical protein
MKTPIIPSGTFLNRECRFVAGLRAGCYTTLVSLALSLPMLVPPAPAAAEVSNAASAAHRTVVHNKRSRIDDRVEALAKYLELNEQQRSAIRTILVQRQQEILQMRLAPSSTGGTPPDRFRAIEDQAMDRIRATLDEGQRNKYDPISQWSLPSEPQQRSVEDWLKASGPR